MIITITTKYTGVVAELAAREGVSRSAFRKERRGALHAMGDYWNRQYRDLHFTERGARKYRYLPRSGARLTKGSSAWRRSYVGRKWRRRGHNDPLVYSGASRTLARTARVRSTANRCEVIIPAPGLNRRNPYSRISMRDEATRVVASEVQQLTKVAEQKMARGLEQVRKTRTVKAP